MTDSADTTGFVAVGRSGISPSLDATGRFVAFDSDVALDAGDINGARDVYVYDRVLDVTTRVSVSSAGAAGNGDSVAAVLSGDGRFVAFLSRATNLVAGDTNGLADVFVHDRQTATTARISVATGGIQATGAFGLLGESIGSFPHTATITYAQSVLDNTAVAVSGDGRIVAFVSDASNLVAGDTNLLPDVFVHDRQTAETTRVSVRSDGSQMADGGLRAGTARPRVSLSADGRFVAFDTLYPLVVEDTNGNRDVYVHDRQTGSTTRASLTPSGLQSTGYSGWPSISGDGQRVAFIVDAYGSRRLFVRDRATNTTTAVHHLNLRPMSPAISEDGHTLVFSDSFWPADVYLHDLAARTTRRVGSPGLTVPANAPSFGPALNADGSLIAFSTAATNLLPSDVNGQDDVVTVSVTPELITNGTFATGAEDWLTFSSPGGGIAWSATNGALQFDRLPGALQAVVFQETQVAVADQAGLTASFALRNTTPARKRVSVLVHDKDFSDLSVCTFWLPPAGIMQTYAMRMRTTRTWANATISFYAATPGTGGSYELDNVSLQGAPSAPAGTECSDPNTPAPPGGPTGPDLLVNGNFGSGSVAPGWATFGQIQSQVSGGVFQFVKLPGAPAGVLLQPTNEQMTAGQVLTATFQLGNSSAVRKRVTVILHDNNFSDLSACTFWLAPGQPLSTYTYRTFATQPWANATLSVYPATFGLEQWIRLDNVTLHRTPSTAISGTECLEPGSSPDGAGTLVGGAVTGTFGSRVSTEADTPGDSDATGTASGDPPDTLVDASGRQWIVDGFERTGEPAPATIEPSWIATSTGARTSTLQLATPLDLTEASGTGLQFDSWLASEPSRALVEVSLDGVTWEAAHLVASSDTWVTTYVSLAGFAGQRIFVRFVFTGAPPADTDLPDMWRIGEVRVTDSPH